ncbi:hypothetical protein GCM10020369_83860 [Cryptosporangium minutisporangium]|uniref:Uncharacterized protein n=1 Tax=Cryptosporangium minutisporangium TaxID=113569 RepID=A0ABP6TDR2_9ACTN
MSRCNRVAAGSEASTDASAGSSPVTAAVRATSPAAAASTTRRLDTFLRFDLMAIDARSSVGADRYPAPPDSGYSWL